MDLYGAPPQEKRIGGGDPESQHNETAAIERNGLQDFKLWQKREVEIIAHVAGYWAACSRSMGRPQQNCMLDRGFVGLSVEFLCMKYRRYKITNS